MIRWRWQPAEPSSYVDVHEHERKRLIAEAEYQQALDAQSKVLRSSQRPAQSVRQVVGIVSRLREDEL